MRETIHAGVFLMVAGAAGFLWALVCGPDTSPTVVLIGAIAIGWGIGVAYAVVAESRRGWAERPALHQVWPAYARQDCSRDRPVSHLPSRSRP